MIPSIFISSTIADLRYLRDGLRDAIEELGYRAVMSEYGEVGYIAPTTAAEACFRNVSECQMVVLILGLRYGSLGRDGVGVTHGEFRTAKKHQVPTITFVEEKVLHYKEVFDADRSAATWDKFPKMDNAKKTFEFLDEIAASESFNATIPFGTVSEVKRVLKLQIADFVWSRFNAVSGTLGAEIRDLLAEVKTLRNSLAHKGEAPAETKKFLASTRYLLNDNLHDYKRFVEQLFGDLDLAITAISQQPDLDSVFEAATAKCERRDPGSALSAGKLPTGELCMFASQSMTGSYAIFQHIDEHGARTQPGSIVWISDSLYEKFDLQQRSLAQKTKM